MGKRLLVALAVVVVVTAGFALAFRLWFPAEKVRTFIASQGSRALGTEVTVGAIHPSLFPLGMRIQDLQVANPAGVGRRRS